MMRRSSPNSRADVDKTQYALDDIVAIRFGQKRTSKFRKFARIYVRFWPKADIQLVLA
jgi:hypothetical protein